MTTFTARFAGIATLMFAVLPAAALTNAARAETPYSRAVHVRIADLNLASADGRAAFAQRADRAAHAWCADRQGVSFKAACQRAVRHEAEDRLALTRQGHVQLARN